MPRKVKDDLAERVRKHLKELELGKKHYKRADAILDEITEEMKPGDCVALNDNGKKAILKDKLAEKKQHFHGSYFRQYEIDVIDA